jgi:hypothetical protein
MDCEIDFRDEQQGPNYLGWAPSTRSAVRRWWVPVLTGGRVCVPARVPRHIVRRIVIANESASDDAFSTAAIGLGSKPIDMESLDRLHGDQPPVPSSFHRRSRAGRN